MPAQRKTTESNHYIIIVADISGGKVAETIVYRYRAIHTHIHTQNLRSRSGERTFLFSLLLSDGRTLKISEADRRGKRVESKENRGRPRGERRTWPLIIANSFPDIARHAIRAELTYPRGPIEKIERAFCRNFPQLPLEKRVTFVRRGMFRRTRALGFSRSLVVEFEGRYRGLPREDGSLLSLSPPPPTHPPSRGRREMSRCLIRELGFSTNNPATARSSKP